MPTAAFGDVFEVPDDYSTIQGAIDAAADGDTIFVAAGVYVENIDFLGKEIEVIGIDGAESTTINGLGDTLGPDYPDVVTFASGEISHSVLQGFTVEYGSRHGIHCDGASPTIVDNIVQLNESDGVRLVDSSPIFERNVIRDHSGFVVSGLAAFGSYSLVIRDCAFSNNQAEFGPAGLYLVDESGDDSVVVLENCTVTENVSDFVCGGLLSGIPTTLKDCFFSGNSTGAFGPGAAIVEPAFVTGGVTVELEGCRFFDNAGAYGGAIMIPEEAGVVIERCVFAGNSASERGGALNVPGDPVTVPADTMTFDRCTFVANSAPLGAVAAQGTSSTTLPADATIEFRNCIIWGSDAPLFELSDGVVNVTYSDVEGGYDGVGNIDADPLFVDLEDADYRLLGGSPCIDAGDPEDPPDPDDTVADMGAYFHAQFGFLRGDVNGNGVVVTLLDAIALLAWQYLGTTAPPCMDAADADDNGAVHALLDSLYLLMWSFLDGPPPPAPGAANCGVDPTEDDVECDTLLTCP